MDAFYSDLGDAWYKILPDRDPDEAQRFGMSVKKFVIYDDPEKIGMSVMERRLSEQHARRHRIEWTLGDIGRLKMELEREVAKLDMPDRDPETGALPLALATAIRVGDADRSGAKFAIVPEAADPVAGYLAMAHEIIVNGLGRVLQGFRYPYEEYVSKVTVGRIYRGVPDEKVVRCAEDLQALLPITVMVDPEPNFFASQSL